MMNLRNAIMYLLLLGLLTTAPCLGVEYEVVNLGTLGAGPSYAYDINNSGQVVGYSYVVTGQFYYHAFLWTASGGMQDLGTLGGNRSFAKGINNSGQVVGYSFTTSGENHAFLWTASDGMQDLGTLGGNYSNAHDINNSGQVVGYSTTASGQMHTFLWPDESGKMQSLGTIGGSDKKTGINDWGQVVGYYTTGGDRACMWIPAEPPQPVGVTVRGTVYDAVSSPDSSLPREPLAGVLVIANENLTLTDMTDVNGKYTIGGLPDEAITVTASKDGYRSETQILPYSIASVTDPQEEGPYFSGQYFYHNEDQQDFKLYLVPQDNEMYHVPSFRPISNGFHFRNQNNHCVGMSMHAISLWSYDILPDPRTVEHDAEGWPLPDSVQTLQIKWLQFLYGRWPGYAMYPWDNTFVDLEELCTSLNSTGPRILLWERVIGGGPHAVVVYKVVKGPSGSFLWLYNNNVPELEERIRLVNNGSGWQLDPGEFTAAKLLPS